ncbi:hypothetical protein ACLOJK_034300 [Asimina triloba]
MRRTLDLDPRTARGHPSSLPACRHQLLAYPAGDGGENELGERWVFKRCSPDLPPDLLATPSARHRSEQPTCSVRRGRRWVGFSSGDGRRRWSEAALDAEMGSTPFVAARASPPLVRYSCYCRCLGGSPVATLFPSAGSTMEWVAPPLWRLPLPSVGSARRRHGRNPPGSTLPSTESVATAPPATPSSPPPLGLGKKVEHHNGCSGGMRELTHMQCGFL